LLAAGCWLLRTKPTNSTAEQERLVFQEDVELSSPCIN
jgi:hypothetical protein